MVEQQRVGFSSGSGTERNKDDVQKKLFQRTHVSAECCLGATHPPTATQRSARTQRRQEREEMEEMEEPEEMVTWKEGFV